MALQPTTPAGAYRPTYGVTYQGAMQPTSGVPMAPTMRSPLPGLMQPPMPGRAPARPAGIVQQPAMGTAPSALSGANGLAGVPAGGYSAMPGGFSGTAPGLLAAPQDTRKLDAFREYDPINLGTVGGLLAGAAGMAVPGLGLLNTGRNIYNTLETDAYSTKVGQPLGFWDHVSGYLGLGDILGFFGIDDANNISADGKTYTLGSPNAGYPKDRSVPGGSIGLGYAPSGYVGPDGYGKRAPGGPTGSSTGGGGMGMRDPGALVGTGGLY